MWAQATFPDAEEQLAGTAEQLPNEASADRPAKCHHASYDASQHESRHQLTRSDPRSYRREQFHVPHPHTAHPAEQPKKQATQGEPYQTLTDPVPAVTHRGDDDATHHEGQHKPVRNATAAQIRNGRYCENDDTRPPGDGVHM